MAGSCCWSRAACLVALWAAVVSNADPKYVDDAKAMYHQTILLPCRTECHGPVIVDRWNIDINGVFEDFGHFNEKNTGKTKYIDNKNASLTIQNPEWEGKRWYRCEWSCKNQDSHNMYSDISILLIKDVKTNNNIGAKVGEKISIPCRGKSESRIIGSVEWHFALPRQPYYSVNTVSGRKHSIDDNKSLLIHNLQKKDAGFYLCELKNVKDFYETKVNIIRDHPPAATTSTLASPTTTANAGPSGVNLTPVYIAVSVVVCTAIACGAVCFARKQWKIRRGNKPDSTSNKGNHAYKSVKVPPAIYESIDPSSEPEPKQKDLERSKNQRSNTNGADCARSSADVPPIVYDTVRAAQPEAALTCADVTINDATRDDSGSFATQRPLRRGCHILKTELGGDGWWWAWPRLSTHHAPSFRVHEFSPPLQINSCHAARARPMIVKHVPT
ncbi:uncharacterized protein LOC116955624 isoform X1 [Petromyzon marinus]|uniref:uncharacterized protein LOC116955624 isoform X1 n=2 Tax=Petromyzon marinus TaxID=7757 RepID=UPI003F71057F